MEPKPSFDIAFHRYSDVLAYPFGWRTGPRSLRVPGNAAVISYTYFFLLLMLLPTARLLVWGFRKLRRHRRLARNLCPQCAYDLRAHKPGERCPECGLTVKRPPQNARALAASHGVAAGVISPAPTAPISPPSHSGDPTTPAG